MITFHASRTPTALSPAQERLWFLQAGEPSSVAHNIGVALQLSGPLCVESLERALGEVVRRHEVLRTTFAKVDAAPVPVITPFTGFTLPRHDLSALSGDARGAELQRLAGEEAQHHFDLAAGPLFRACLLRIDTDEHVLLINTHHILMDGWSLRVLFGEMSMLYAAYRDNRESPLPELTLQYGDFAEWQRGRLQKGALGSQLAYWKRQLSDATGLLELPTDHERPPVHLRRGASVKVAWPAVLLERLRTLGRRGGATLFMVLLSAVSLLLAKYSGSREVAVGSPAAGRTRREFEGLIGRFVNTLVLRTTVDGELRIRELVHSARAVALSAYDHQDVPFERIVAELQPIESSHHALFQVLFLVDDGPAHVPELPDVEVEGLEVDGATTPFDLMVRFEARDELRAELTYDTALFERTTIARMGTHLGEVLTQMVANPDGTVAAVTLSTPDAQTDDRTLPAPIDPQAATTPGTVAPSTASARDQREARVVDAWRAVLGLDDIDIHHNFFEIGGNSVLCYSVLARLRDLRPDLEVVDLFRYPTVATLAAFLSSAAPHEHTAVAQSRDRARARRAARAAR